MRDRSRILRRVRRSLLILTGSLLVFVLLVAIAIQLRPLREEALRRALAQASDMLPGTLLVGASHWTSLERLEFEDILWTSDADTLLSAGYLRVEPDLRALFHRDIHLRRLHLDALRADLGPLVRSFAPEDSSGMDTAKPRSSGSPFPRKGSIPGVPSIGVDRLDVSAPRIVLPDSTVLQGELDLGIELRAAREPRAVGGVELREPGRPALGLVLDAPAAETWTLVLRLTQGDPLLSLAVHGEAEGPNRMDRGRLHLDLELPGLESATGYAQLDSLYARVPELAGASLRADGGFDLSPEPRSGDPWIDLELGLQDWPVLRRADGSLRWASSGSELRLDLQDLGGATGVLVVQGRHPLYELQLNLELSGPPRLQPYLEEDQIPADLQAELEARADLDLNSSAMDGGATLRASIPSRKLDQIELELQARGDASDATGSLTSFARSGELSVSSRVDWARSELIAAQLSPLLVRMDSTARAVPPDLALLPDSRLSLDEKSGELELEGLRVEGDAGRGRVDLLWSSHAARALDLDWEWETRPAILDLLGPGVSARDSTIRALWRDDRSYRMRLTARERSAASEAYDVDFTANLPAPGLLLPSLPRSLGADEASLQIQGSASGGLDSARVSLRAEPNPWLESLELSLRHTARWTVLDSMELQLPGLVLRAEGRYEDEQLDAAADLSFHHDVLLQELLGDAVSKPSARVAARLELSGRLDALDADLLAGAELSAEQGSVDTLALHAQVREQRLESAQLHARQLRYHRWRLDDLDLQWRGEGEPLLPGVAALQLRGPQLEFLQVFRVQRDSVWTAEVDTLGLVVAGTDLRSSHPFRVLARPESKAVWIDGLDLTGRLGELRGDLRFGPRVKQGSLEMHLVLPDAPREWSIPEGAWPATVDLDLVVDPSTLELRARSEGMGLGSRRDLVFDLLARSEADSSYLELTLRDEESALLQGNLLLPYGYVADGPRWEPRPGRPRVELRTNRLPLPARPGDPHGLQDYFLGKGQDAAPVLDAELRVDRSQGEPRGALQARVDFPGIPELARDALLLGAVWSAPRDSVPDLRHDPELDRLLRDAHSELEERGVGLRVEWAVDEQARMEMGAYSPLSWDSQLGRLDWNRSQLRARLRTSQLQLEDFNRFLPDRVRVKGSLEASLTAQGDPSRMELEGRLSGRELGYADPGRAEAVADLDFSLSGTTKVPVIRGTIEVRKGTLRIQDRSKSFLDVTGRSLLWDAARDQAGKQSDDAPLFGADALVAANDSTTAPTLLPPDSDMSVDLSIPQSFWIRGRGLDVRLTGDLHMSQEEGKPVVVGKLTTVEGRFSFMSKTFQARRGVVEFFGDPNNPSLDIEVNAKVSDADITIRIRGTAQKPELEMRSDPYMEEAEIMSYLLFGGPTASLDQAGSDLLSQQAMNALEGFAIPALEGGVASDLGISMIQLKQNDTAGKGMNILVGRYITPEILLKYEMSLEDSQDYTVNLEYWINRRLSLQSYFSQAKESGIEVNWSKDY